MKKLLGLLCIAAFLSLTPTAKAQTTATISDSGNVLKITLDGVVQMVQKNNLLLKIDGPYLQIRSTAGDYLQNIKITSISTPSHATNAALLATIKGYLNTIQSQTITVSDTVWRNGHTNIHIGNFPATQPVSGTVSSNATQTGTWTVQPGNTANTTAWKVDGSAVTQPVSLSSVPTHAVTQSGTFTVQPGNTANTTAWKVDGSAVTQPVSGTFWQSTQPVSLASVPTHAVTQSGLFTVTPGNTGYSYNHINTAVTTNVCTGAGVLHSIVVSKPGTSGVLTVYDNTSGAGTVIAVTGATTSCTLIYDLNFTTGITIVSTFGVAGDYTVTYKQ